MTETKIDVSFDFTTDTPSYWENYWDSEMGKSSADPDILSKKMREYHKLVWSKELPNGSFLNLKFGTATQYLTWNEFRFGSDSIATSFRNKRNESLIKKVISAVPNYKEFIESYVRKTYTIGGVIIFPKMMGGINQTRGCNHKIRDRFDLTLECIRRYYNNDDSPLYEALLRNKKFFDLFLDFKGYVDFFFLQDLVDEDYNHVNFLIGNGSFEDSPIPRDVSEYLLWIEKQMQFVEKRNNRIKQHFDLKSN
ncbi:MAG: hypothetical protein IKD35_03810 [Clostridia bacterium]|nr:hypothetical protein [Clostridia bacterium]